MLNPASREPLRLQVRRQHFREAHPRLPGAGERHQHPVRPRRTRSHARSRAIDLDGVTLEQALNLVLTTNSLFYKVLNEKTILIIPDNPPSAQQYEEQVIRTFYLSHADVTEMLTLLNGHPERPRRRQTRPMIQPSKTANTITVRGSAALVAIAERIIENNDKPRAEVVIDVEILEVNRHAREAVRPEPLELRDRRRSSRPRRRREADDPERAGPGGGGTAATTHDGQFNLNTITHGHQHLRLLPRRAELRRAVPRVRHADEADRQAVAARRRRHEARAQPRRRHPGAVDDVPAARRRRRRDRAR